MGFGSRYERWQQGRCTKAHISIGCELGLSLVKACHEEGNCGEIPAACACFGLREGSSRVSGPSLLPIFPGLPSCLWPGRMASVDAVGLLLVVGPNLLPLGL